MPVSMLLFLLSSLLQTSLAYYAYYGACQPYNRRVNPVLCASYIRQIASDPNKFWFGTSYDTICPVKAPDTKLSPCSDPPKEGFAMSQFQSLGRRLFSDPNFNAATDLAMLQYPIDVTYTSTADVVQGCNTSLVSTTSRYIDINPHMYPVAAWHLRNPPMISTPGCTLTSLCTIVMLDVGHMVLHGIWTNWPRDKELVGYVRPGHNSLTTNPYVFAVLRQVDDNVTVNVDDFTATWSFEMRPFITDNNLQGPIALTWANVIGDIDSAQRLADDRITQNCPELLIISLYAARYQFTYDLGIVTPATLSFWVTAKYDTPQPRLQTCCNTVSNEAWMDPIRFGFLFPVDIQNAPKVTMEARVRAATDEDLAGKFTLMMCRLDRAYPLIASSATSMVYINWLVYNSEGTDLSEGTQALSYQPPVGVNGVCMSNRFYLLVFQQADDEDLKNVDPQLTANCTPDTTDKRCRLNLVQFVATNKLTLVGVSRLRTPCSAYGASYAYGPFKAKEDNSVWQLDNNPLLPRKTPKG